VNKKNTDSGLFDSIKYCTRCCFPSTIEGITFDSLGICNVCQSSENKMRIEWNKREEELRNILNKAKKSSGNNYDCVLPISGGKDSFYQAHVLTKVYKLNPLAVTFSHNWYSETGFYNLQLCLETFNLDHLQFTPARKTVNNLAKKSLSLIGDSCWHCHAGVGSFPLQVAVMYKIPLLVWGESLNEADGRSTYNCPTVKFDRDYFTKVSARYTAEEIADKDVPLDRLQGFVLPSYAEIDKTGVWGIHLGDYIFWDDERQTEFIINNYGWKETQMEGTYKRYKSAECIMSGMHDYTCYLKRGFGRSTWQASVDVRNGILTREEAMELINYHDSTEPQVLDYYLDITGIDKEEFIKIIEEKRLDELVGKEFNIRKNPYPNEEKLVPFVQQIIQKHKPKKS
tara:strand:- start:738 stop:1931 length:1194 start_codon:yes stop_codon:yes gene_type:complete